MRNIIYSYTYDVVVVNMDDRSVTRQMDSSFRRKLAGRQHTRARATRIDALSFVAKRTLCNLAHICNAVRTLLLHSMFSASSVDTF